MTRSSAVFTEVAAALTARRRRALTDGRRRARADDDEKERMHAQEKDSRAPARAWFENDEENSRVTVHVQDSGRARANARMAHVRAVAAEDAARALTHADAPMHASPPPPRAPRAVDAGVMTDEVRTRERATLARATCRACAANVRALRDVHIALRACRSRERELIRQKSPSAASMIAFGSTKAVKAPRDGDARRSTSVNVPSDVVARADANRVCIPDTRPLATFTDSVRVTHDVTRARARHARKTAVMARRSRERRAARAAAAARALVSHSPPRGKPEWNDCVDLNASPRIQTSDEHFALLRRLVAAKNREENVIKERRAREKRRRRLAAVAAAAAAARETAARRMVDESKPIMRAARASFDSVRSFKSAVESVGNGVRHMSIASSFA